MKEESAEQARSIKKTQLEIEKELLDDPVQRKLKKMKAVQSVYNSLSCSGIRVNTMSNADPVSELIGKFEALIKDD